VSASSPGWTGFAERGSLRALRAAQALHRLFGRRLTRAILLPLAAYFALTAGSARRASREYLRTLYESPGGAEALGRPPRARDVLRHFHAFSVNLFDRMVVWGGAVDDVHFEHRGSEHLFRLAREKRGGILLGSHLGSFDMMRLLAGRYGLVVNVLMFTRHAERITAFFQSLDPSSRLRVIQLDPEHMRTAFEIRACLARGEFVGILGDRLPPGPAERTARVPFLGRPAAFSLRPFLLAAALGRPLLFAVCLRRGPDTYEAVVEPIADPAPVPRAAREAVARGWLASYAAHLEACCREEPYQWFNFYPFWASGREAL
jgi:predicted LPLAT superfamily acyltransferase